MTTEQIISQCGAYEPYRLRTADEQMSREEMLQQLEELRSIYLGTRRSMALGIAINTIKRLQQGKEDGL